MFVGCYGLFLLVAVAKRTLSVNSIHLAVQQFLSTRRIISTTLLPESGRHWTPCQLLKTR